MSRDDPSAVAPGSAGGASAPPGKGVALYPGSFDPLTSGHVDIIERAARLFPRLIVVVGYNPNKQSLFTVAERLRFVGEVTAGLGNVGVDSFTGELLVEYARRVGATIVVRGLRDRRDYHNEFIQSQMNQRMMPTLETVFLLTDPAQRETSSTLVRAIIRSGGDYRHLVPEIVWQARQAAGGR